MGNPLLVVVTVALGILGISRLLNSRKKVFVSYFYREDSRYKNLLLAWTKNETFDIEFDDVSADVSIRSDDDSAIKRVLSRKIKECDVVLVLLGEKTHRRKWIRWEIEKAKEYEKRIVAVKLSQQNASPKELLGAGVVWARSFEFEAIRRAIDD